MISRYNRNQVILAVLAAVGGGLCFWLAYLFFRYGLAFVAERFDYRLSSSSANLIAFVALAAISFSGYRTWAARGGLQGYHESAFYHELPIVSGGALAVSSDIHSVTGPAHVLSQLFLAGPLLLLKAGTLIHSLIKDSPELEQRLAEALAMLRKANKWQSLNEYPAMKAEILHLAQMGQIDFSAHKGTPRIKAETPHGA